MILIKFLTTIILEISLINAGFCRVSASEAESAVEYYSKSTVAQKLDENADANSSRRSAPKAYPAPARGKSPASNASPARGISPASATNAYSASAPNTSSAPATNASPAPTQNASPAPTPAPKQAPGVALRNRRALNNVNPQPNNAAVATRSPAAAQPSSQKPSIPAEFEGCAPEIEKILLSGHLRVGICPVDQPPFHVKNADGTISGFDVDLAKGIADALKVKLTIVEVPDWDQTITYLLNRKIDIIVSNLSLTPERASKILCSTPYARIHQCMLLNRILLARATGEDLYSLRDIFTNYVNRQIIVQDGTSYVNSASSMFPEATVTAEPSWSEIIKGLLDRRYMGTISDELEIKQQTAHVQTMELLPVIIKDQFDLLIVGVNRLDPQLLHFVNSYIEANNVQCKLDGS
ncbi:MAG: transporter substrate-binding domain-containing protein [Holosporales bacterium]|jgi:ABC-type amino acid transport substrate-binding protein|nr:transporter substrate-binding domain-containing protein [Holosporales bacterium]